MNIQRRKEGKLILILSLSSIVLWFLISTNSYNVGFYTDFVYNLQVIDWQIFCEIIEKEIWYKGTHIPAKKECSFHIILTTKTATIFSFIWVVYGLLLYFELVPSLREISNKLRNNNENTSAPINENNNHTQNDHERAIASIMNLRSVSSDNAKNLIECNINKYKTALVKKGCSESDAMQKAKNIVYQKIAQLSNSKASKNVNKQEPTKNENEWIGM